MRLKDKNHCCFGDKNVDTSTRLRVQFINNQILNMDKYHLETFCVHRTATLNCHLRSHWQPYWGTSHRKHDKNKQVYLLQFAIPLKTENSHDAILSSLAVPVLQHDKYQFATILEHFDHRKHSILPVQDFQS